MPICADLVISIRWCIPKTSVYPVKPGNGCMPRYIVPLLLKVQGQIQCNTNVKLASTTAYNNENRMSSSKVGIIKQAYTTTHSDKAKASSINPALSSVPNG